MYDHQLSRSVRRLTLLTVLFIPALAWAQSPSILRHQLERIVDHWGGPGAVVVIINDGEVRYAEGFGTTTAAGDTYVAPHTLVSVQSVTKPFTAVALGMLVDEGKISWDDPVQEHLADFSFDGPYVSSRITIRDLISHRSGLPIFMGGGPFGEDSISEILAGLPDEESQMGFREGVAYSNVGMALLGEIIARVTGTSWDAFVSSRILKPLGMSASYASAREVERLHGDLGKVPNLMWPVNRTDSGLVNGPWRHWNPPYCPAACIMSTASDMAHFMHFLLDEGVFEERPLLRAATLREMWIPHGVRAFAIIADYEPFINPLAGSISYGLGFYMHEYRGRVVVEHVGSGGGSSGLALIPSARIGVFVSTNADYPLASDRMVSALKFAAIDYALGLPPTDWIALLGKTEE